MLLKKERMLLYHCMPQPLTMWITIKCGKFHMLFTASDITSITHHVFKLDLEKADRPEIKLPTFDGSLKKQESSRKTSTSASLISAKPLTVWITISSVQSLSHVQLFATP